MRIESKRRSSMRRDRGTALLATVVLGFTLMALAGLFLSTSFNAEKAATRDEALARARLAADEGIYRSIAEIRSGTDGDANGIGNVLFTGSDSRRITVTATAIGSVWSISSKGTFGGISQSTATVMEFSSFSISCHGTPAAIVSKSSVNTLGSIVIDGRDHDSSGAVVTGPGVYGISTLGLVTMGGASKVGGRGVAPTKTESTTIVKENDPWTDAINNDGDAKTDEELFDGIDNDGDGKIDEDTKGFPSSPDVFLHAPEGSLKAYAQAQKTYFTSKTEFDSYISAHSGSLPGGGVYYLDFDNYNGANLSATMNADPSILVHHNSTGTASMTNVHKNFKGLIIADSVGNLNGDFVLIGSLISFSTSTAANSYGNGNANILYSSTVLSTLPGSTATGTQAKIRSWHRTATTP